MKSKKLKTVAFVGALVSAAALYANGQHAEAIGVITAALSSGSLFTPGGE